MGLVAASGTPGHHCTSTLFVFGPHPRGQWKFRLLSPPPSPSRPPPAPGPRPESGSPRQVGRGGHSGRNHLSPTGHRVGTPGLAPSGPGGCIGDRPRRADLHGAPEEWREGRRGLPKANRTLCGPTEHPPFASGTPPTTRTPVSHGTGAAPASGTVVPPLPGDGAFPGHRDMRETECGTAHLPSLAARQPFPVDARPTVRPLPSVRGSLFFPATIAPSGTCGPSSHETCLWDTRNGPWDKRSKVHAFQRGMLDLKKKKKKKKKKGKKGGGNKRDSGGGWWVGGWT